MGRMRLSISSSRRLPWAFLGALGILGLTNAGIDLLVERDVLVAMHTRRAHNERLRQAQQANASFMTMGNSAAEGLFPVMPWPVPPGDEAAVFELILPGAMPRTHLFILEAVEFQCVRPGAKVLLYFTPSDLNRNNRGLRRTIASFFSWKEFIGELLVNWRVDDMKFFLADRSFSLLNYRHEIRAWLGFRPDWLTGPDGRLGQDPEAPRLRRRPLWNYQLDPYQGAAVSKILQGLQQRQVSLAMVLLPCSPRARQLLGEENLARFLEKAYDIAAQHHVPVLDYVSGYTGEEYEYADGAHFTESSKQLFNRVLGSDVWFWFQPTESQHPRTAP